MGIDRKGLRVVPGGKAPPRPPDPPPVSKNESPSVLTVLTVRGLIRMAREHNAEIRKSWMPYVCVHRAALVEEDLENCERLLAELAEKLKLSGL